MEKKCMFCKFIDLPLTDCVSMGCNNKTRPLWVLAEATDDADLKELIAQAASDIFNGHNIEATLNKLAIQSFLLGRNE